MFPSIFIFSVLYLGMRHYSFNNTGQYVFSTFVACVTRGCHHNCFLSKQTVNHGITALVIRTGYNVIYPLSRSWQIKPLTILSEMYFVNYKCRKVRIRCKTGHFCCITGYGLLSLLCEAFIIFLSHIISLCTGHVQLTFSHH